MARVIGLVTFQCDDLADWEAVEAEVHEVPGIICCAGGCDPSDLQHIVDFGDGSYQDDHGDHDHGG